MTPPPVLAMLEETPEQIAGRDEVSGVALLQRAKAFVDAAPRFDWNEDRAVMVAVHLSADIAAHLRVHAATLTPQVTA